MWLRSKDFGPALLGLWLRAHAACNPKHKGGASSYCGALACVEIVVPVPEDEEVKDGETDAPWCMLDVVEVVDAKHVCVGSTVVVPTWANIVAEAAWAGVGPGVDDSEEDWDAGRVIAAR